MEKLKLYDGVCFDSSKTMTYKYSTSFASAIRLLSPSLHAPIHGIYGFVRLADEVVDSFHHIPQERILAELKSETYKAIELGFSVNPIIHSFQQVINKFGIDLTLIEAFFVSMEADLHKSKYKTYDEYSDYIYGSAEVVGLMCLHVFCLGNKTMIEQLKLPARALGAAFQKINFLRDLKEDYHELNRTYFPGLHFDDFNEGAKSIILQDIEKDFKEGLIGIMQLPLTARFGVFVAYKYYFSLYKKIKKLPSKTIKEQRVRIPDYNKVIIIFESFFRFKLQMIY